MIEISDLSLSNYMDGKHKPKQMLRNTHETKKYHTKYQINEKFHAKIYVYNILSLMKKWRERERQKNSLAKPMWEYMECTRTIQKYTTCSMNLAKHNKTYGLLRKSVELAALRCKKIKTEIQEISCANRSTISLYRQTYSTHIVWWRRTPCT